MRVHAKKLLNSKSQAAHHPSVPYAILTSHHTNTQIHLQRLKHRGCSMCGTGHCACALLVLLRSAGCQLCSLPCSLQHADAGLLQVGDLGLDMSKGAQVADFLRSPPAPCLSAAYHIGTACCRSATLGRTWTRVQVADFLRSPLVQSEASRFNHELPSPHGLMDKHANCQASSLTQLRCRLATLAWTWTRARMWQTS